ncbi:MAG: OmpP1/FadL family transporter, partial [Nannocystaceae bacterium]
RWYTIDGSLRSLYFTGALAFNIEKIGLSIGLSGSAIRSNVETIRARNTDGTDHLLNDKGTIKEGRSLVNVKGWQGGFGLGVAWHLRDLFWVGASYTSQPNVSGGMRLKGTLTNVLAALDSEESNVALTQTLPDIFRLGIRVRPTKKVELRLFGDYTRWSVMDKQCVFPEGVAGNPCDEFTNIDTALTDPSNFGAEPELDDGVAITQHLPRFWRDGGGVRAGASYWFIPQLEGYVGVGYDSSAVPVQTIEPALMDANKVTVSLGARAQIIKNLGLAMTLTDVIYLPVDTQGQNVLNDFQTPTKQADANGVYKQNIGLLNVYVDVSF